MTEICFKVNELETDINTAAAAVVISIVSIFFFFFFFFSSSSSFSLYMCSRNVEFRGLISFYFAGYITCRAPL